MGQLIIKYNQTNRSNKSPKINNREKETENYTYKIKNYLETFILKEIKKTSELIESLLFKYSSEFFKDYKDLHFKIVYNLKEKV